MKEDLAMAKKHQSSTFCVCIFLSIISIGILNCNKKAATMKDSDSAIIDPGNFKPVLICTDFQNLSPGTTLQNEFDFGKFKLGADFGARIIQIPAPSNAHPWVPNPLHFIEAPFKNSTAHVTISFQKPVQWVEIDLAWGKCDAFSSTKSITANLVNSKNHSSESKVHDLGPTVKTMVFTAADKVKKGSGELGQPVEWYPAGDITQIEISSLNCDIRLWRICYWPSIN
jgi:hypothetical protein